MLYKMSGEDLAGTSEHPRWFKGGSRTAYKQRLFDVGGYPFLLSLHILSYSKATDNCDQRQLKSCFVFLNTSFEFKALS